MCPAVDPDGRLPNGHAPAQGNDAPIFSPQRLSVVCIGAGVSGIALAIHMQRTLEAFDLDIYEKNNDIGGTWLENRYPGCACDVPAHAYTYTFEPNPNYSQYYVGSEEIQAYLVAVAKKYDVQKYVHLNHTLTSAVWCEDRGVWDIELRKIGSQGPQILRRSCNILINATGALNNWKWPTIPGLQDFKGLLTHSANWDQEQDFTNKSIAVIGAGSSGIQIVPALQPHVAQMYAFIRSPTWIAPSQGFVDPTDGGKPLGNIHYTAEEKKRFHDNPEEFLQYRKDIESSLNRIIEVFIKDSPKQIEARKIFAQVMRSRLGNDERLASLLIPEHSVGCRRLTPGQGFLEALVKPNVEVVSAEIERVEPEGLVTADGILHRVDAIICATGFDTTYRPRFHLEGKHGSNLAELWRDLAKIEAYMAMAVPDFPNYFMFLGPNSPISNGTLIPVIEKQAEYMVSMMRKYQRQRVKSFSPQHHATNALNRHLQRTLTKFVWTDSCRSWYKGGLKDGKVIGVWPGSSLHYFEAISEPKWEDWEYTYWQDEEEDEQDRQSPLVIANGIDTGVVKAPGHKGHGHGPRSGLWDYLGNGFTRLEARDSQNGGKEDLAWYLQKPDVVLDLDDCLAPSAK